MYYAMMEKHMLKLWPNYEWVVHRTADRMEAWFIYRLKPVVFLRMTASEKSHVPIYPSNLYLTRKPLSSHDIINLSRGGFNDESENISVP